MHPAITGCVSTFRFPKARAGLFGVVLALSGLFSPAEAKDDIALELNRLQTAESDCQAYFLIQEKVGKPLRSLKADLIIFGKDGGIAKRLLAELGPVRSKKTSVKIFAIEVPCLEISGVLLNDIASCAPNGTPDTCLDRLALSSRLATRFYK